MTQYSYSDAEPAYDQHYLLKPLRSIIAGRSWPDRRAFDLGCGNGVTCRTLASLGFAATGVDVSESGVAVARSAGVDAFVGSAYDNLAATYGTYPLVVSFEVIEHCMEPRAFARTFLSLIAPGGVGVLSTPYHGYLKNLALAVSGSMDAHYTALWDGGHVKFFSTRTLRVLLDEAGARSVEYACRAPAGPGKVDGCNRHLECFREKCAAVFPKEIRRTQKARVVPRFN